MCIYRGYDQKISDTKECVYSTHKYIDKCVKNVYYIHRKDIMKRRDLIKKLENAGFELERHGGDHDIYKRGSDEEQVPRHREINERLAGAILKRWEL